MHICVGKLNIIGSDNGLSPGRRQAIIWTNAGILLIEPLGTNFSEILIGIPTFSFKKMHLKMSSAKWRPFCLGLNVLIHQSCHDFVSRTSHIVVIFNLIFPKYSLKMLFLCEVTVVAKLLLPILPAILSSLLSMLNACNLRMKRNCLTRWLQVD